MNEKNKKLAERRDMVWLHFSSFVFVGWADVPKAPERLYLNYLGIVCYLKSEVGSGTLGKLVEQKTVGSGLIIDTVYHICPHTNSVILYFPLKNFNIPAIWRWFIPLSAWRRYLWLAPLHRLCNWAQLFYNIFQNSWVESWRSRGITWHFLDHVFNYSILYSWNN